MRARQPERAEVIRLHAPSRLDRLWFSWLGVRPPQALARADLPSRLVRLLPQWLVPVHWWWTRLLGLWWLPCWSCGRRYGGHQATAYSLDGERRGVCPCCVRLDTGKRVLPPWSLPPPVARSQAVRAFLVTWLLFELTGLAAFSIVLGGELAGGSGHHPWWVYLVGMVTTGYGTATTAALLLSASPRSSWYAGGAW